MYNIARCCLFIFMFIVADFGYAQEWIPYQHHHGTIIQQPVVAVQPLYVDQQPYVQPLVIYQWTPYVVQQTFVVEKQCLFHRTQTVYTRPVVQYVYQPFISYR